MARVNELAGDSSALISLSGGNPALQPLGPVIALGRRHSHSFALETQGSVSQAWFAELDWLILSPKASKHTIVLCCIVARAHGFRGSPP
jgi:7-carboxy-7-deazaguanine synthase